MSEPTHRVTIEKQVGGQKQTYVFAYQKSTFPQIHSAIGNMVGHHGFDTIDAVIATVEAHRRIENEK